MNKRSNDMSRSKIAQKLELARVLHRAGLFKFAGLSKTRRIIKGARAWGRSPAFGFTALAVRQPDSVAVIDDGGSATFRELDRRSNALARGLRQVGIGEGSVVGLMGRNHRGFIESLLACSKVGANTLLLNTMFGAPQLADVAEREGMSGLIYDEEFSGVLSDVVGMPRFTSFGAGEAPSISEVITTCSGEEVEAPTVPGRFTLLTSGTTGAPKGAKRGPEKGGLFQAASMLSRLPLRWGERTKVAAPMFHSWGLGHFQLGLLLGSTLVLNRQFDPEATLRSVEQNRCTSLAVVPIMMQRILALPGEVKRRYDLSSLRVTASSGSALPGHLAVAWMDTFGDNLYNLYGSTEVAMASIANPQDLRAAPGTAGRPPTGTRVRILDAQGAPLGVGRTGRIFVASGMSFDGYTSGDDKEQIGEFVSSGDVGHFDGDGRLFVDGRDDEMIISGGENLFPREVEDLIAKRTDVVEVAVIGASDEEWGQRLQAFVVAAAGAKLDEDDIRAYVKSSLASYKVPRDVFFVDSLPRNATGKVLKRALGAEQPAASS